MKSVPRLRLNFKAFTLVELVMTMIVLGIISVPLSLMLSQQINSVFVSEDYITALNLARLELERANNANYTNLISGSNSSYEGYSYDMVRNVTYANGTVATAESLKKISVDIKKSGSAAALVNLVTYRAKNVNFGP